MGNNSPPLRPPFFINKHTPEIIVLNSMYGGDYLKQKNLGHEVINIYKSDQGENYVYLMSDGKFDKGKYSKAKYFKSGDPEIFETVIHVKRLQGQRYEVLAVATGLERVYGKVKSHNAKKEAEIQKEYMDEKAISYGKAPILNIFDDAGSPNQGVYITFKAQEVIRPEKPVYIDFDHENVKISENTAVIKSKKRNISQLDKYIEIVEELNEKRSRPKEIHPFVLLPNYNDIDITQYSNKYTKVFYSKVYDLFVNASKKYGTDGDFTSFTDAMKRHTFEYDNQLYYDTTRLLRKRISQMSVKK